MSPLATVMLRHTHRGGAHFDWLIEQPPALDQAGRLWTSRTPIHTMHWADAGKMVFTPLGPHRRRYLTWQGPIGGDRGSVARVDHGWVTSELWTPHRLVLDVSTHHFNGRIEIRLLSVQTAICAVI